MQLLDGNDKLSEVPLKDDEFVKEAADSEFTSNHLAFHFIKTH